MGGTLGLADSVLRHFDLYRFSEKSVHASQTWNSASFPPPVSK